MLAPGGNLLLVFAAEEGGVLVAGGWFAGLERWASCHVVCGCPDARYRILMRHGEVDVGGGLSGSGLLTRARAC